ncbi:MAG: PAS domain-containing protein [Sulfuricaulis sp.]
MPDFNHKIIAKVLLPYAAFGALCLYLSDRVLADLASDPADIILFQHYKGLFFITVSVALLYLLLRHYIGMLNLARQERERLRERIFAILESMTDGFVALDADWRYIFVNRRAGEMFGHAPQYLIGKNIWEEFPEGVGQKFYHAYRRALSTQQQVNIEEYYPPWDRWFENRIYPSPDGLYIFFQETTERKRTEVELQRMSRLYNTLSETNQAIVRATDSAALFQTVCDIAVKFGGFQLAWIGLPEGDWMRVAAAAGPARSYAEDIIVSVRADLPEGQGPSGCAFRSGEHFICDDFFRNPISTPWHERAARFGIASAAMFPLRQAGQVIGVLNIYAAEPDYFHEPEIRLLDEMAIDLSFALDNLEQQRSLREREQDLEAIVENLPLMVFAKDAKELRLVRLNRAGEELLGIPRNDLLDKSDRDLFPPDQAEFFLAQDRETLVKGETVDIPEEPIDTPRGRRLVHTRKVVVRDQDGQARYLLGISEDITERKRAEEARRETAHQLEILSRRLLAAQETERRRIARELHDEIGQLLTVVKLDLQTVLRQSKVTGLAPAVKESMEAIDRVVARVRDLSLDLRPSMLDDLGLAPALRWYVQRSTKHADAEVGLHLPASLPRLPPDVETTCFRIVQEALTNALRHAGAERIDVTLTADDDAVELTVRDNGKGFDVRVAERRAMTGAGFGLLSMTERAQLAGGRLTLDSRPGGGTAVRARIPLAPAPAV